MAKHFSLNITSLQDRTAIFELKQMLVSVGWTVTQSGDGTAYSDSGDLITDEDKLATARAWFAIESPVLAHGARRSLVIQSIAVVNTAETWRIAYSKGAGFTGGAPDATTAPTASDEGLIAGGGTAAAPTGTAIGYSSQRIARRTHIVVDDETHGFAVYGWMQPSNPALRYAGTVFFLDPLLPSSYEPVDADPAVAFANGLSNTPFSINTTLSANSINHPDTGPKTWFSSPVKGDQFGGVQACLYASDSSAATWWAASGMGDSAVSTNRPLLPLLYARPYHATLGSGVKGFSSLMRLPSRQDPDMTLSADKLWISIGRVVLPWDGETEVDFQP